MRLTFGNQEQVMNGDDFASCHSSTVTGELNSWSPSRLSMKTWDRTIFENLDSSTKTGKQSNLALKHTYQHESTFKQMVNPFTCICLIIMAGWLIMVT